MSGHGIALMLARLPGLTHGTPIALPPSMRTDEHSPSRIVPANYTYVCSYSTDRPNYPAINAAAIELAEFACTSDGAKVYGRSGKCGVCGAVYAYGDIWRHMTGDLVHVGHDCADKYRLLANRSEWQMAHERALHKMQLANARVKQAKARAALFEANPGLEPALAHTHYICQDIARRFTQYGSISLKQIALVIKIHGEATGQRSRQATTTPAPVKPAARYTDAEIEACPF